MHILLSKARQESRNKINNMLVREMKQFYTYTGVLSYPRWRIFHLEPRIVELKVVYLFGKEGKKKICYLRVQAAGIVRSGFFQSVLCWFLTRPSSTFLSHSKTDLTYNKDVLLGSTVTVYLEACSRNSEGVWAAIWIDSRTHRRKQELSSGRILKQYSCQH